MLGGNVVAEIFSQSTLSSPTCVAWRWVLLPDVRSSRTYPSDRGQHYRLQAFDVGSVLSMRPSGKMDGGMMSQSLMTTLNIIMWTRCLVFINISRSMGTQQTNNYSLSSSSSGGNYSYLRSMFRDFWIC